MAQDHVTRGIVSRMRNERYRRGWSTEQFSSIIARSTGFDFSRAIITNLENNRRDYMTVGELLSVARVFNTTLEWLVWGSGVACIQCDDKPPAGFTCNDCDRSASVRVKDILDQQDWFRSYI